jgi:hypothetical protein
VAPHFTRFGDVESAGYLDQVAALSPVEQVHILFLGVAKKHKILKNVFLFLK